MKLSYQYAKTKKEILIRKLGLLIDYKTLIAIAIIAIGIILSLPWVSVSGGLYFVLHFVILMKIIFNKQNGVSIDYKLEDEELIVQVENQQLVFAYHRINHIRERKKYILIKMDKDNKGIMQRIEIPFDVHKKPIEFVEELKRRMESIEEKRIVPLEEDNNLILAFRLNPKQEVYHFIKYSKRTYLYTLFSIVCLFFSIMLIDSSLISSIILWLCIGGVWLTYYIDYHKIQSKSPLRYTIRRLDTLELTHIEIAGNGLRSTYAIKKLRLLNLHNKMYLLSIVGEKGIAYRFTKEDIVGGDILALIALTGEKQLNNIGQPILPLIFAIGSLVCVPLAGVFIEYPIVIGLNVLLFLLSLIFSIVYLIKPNRIKRFVYMALGIDLLILVFYIYIFSLIG